uniref:Sperm microtubule inner protein 7 n=1 Tax=Sphenodon punctatus TaxID=8508 RepID=A0A8D0HJ43_SPHPU
MVSQVAERHINAFRCPSPLIEPRHKMDRQQYHALLKRMYMPFVRGPEDRHYFASFQDKDSNSFLKFNPYNPPVGKDYPLFPHRDNVPLGDPCSGFMSAGGDANLQPICGRTIPSLVDFSDVKPQQRIPSEDKNEHTTHRRHTMLLEELNQDRRWNSRAVPDASIRARLGGWTSPVKVTPAPPKTKDSLLTHRFAFELDPNLKVMCYEDVSWDSILLPKVEPPDSTAEKMADPVSQCFTIKRYEPRPEISQIVGGLWDRFQTRPFTSPHRPINFSPNIPGYTGKVHWTATHPANSNLPPTSPSIIARTCIRGKILIIYGNPPRFNHQGPLSRTLTPVEPQNSFNKVERERIKV